MAGTRLENGQLQSSSPGHTVGTERSQKKTRTTKEELDGHHQARPQEHELDLRRLRYWQMTKQNGVNAWPNAVVWMRDELRSKVRVT